MARLFVILFLAAALAGIWLQLIGRGDAALEPGARPASTVDAGPAELVGRPQPEGGRAGPASVTGAPALAGILTDRATGEPLPHFLLEWTRPGAEVISVTTDEDGRFRCVELATGRWTVRYVDDPALRALREEREEIELDGGSLELATEVGPTFHVQVALPDGLAASELRLVLRNANPFSSQMNEETTAPLRTHAGRLWCRLPPVRHVFPQGPFNATLAHAGGRWHAGLRYVEETEGRADEPLAFTLVGLGGIDLGVFGADGQPLKVLELELTRMEPRTRAHGELPNASALHSPKGARTLFSDVQAGRYEVLVRTHTCEHERFPVTVRGGEVTPLDVHPTPLPPRVSVDGRILLEEGNGLEEFSMRFTSLDSPDRYHATRVDPSWSSSRNSAPFTASIPSGRYRVRPMTRRFLRWEPATLDFAAPAEGLELRLVEPGPRHVAWLTIVDDVTGAPLRGARVEAVGADGAANTLVAGVAGVAGISLHVVSRVTFTASADGYRETTFDERALTLDKSGPEPVLRALVRLVRE